jgi:hypothetical protein
VNINESAILFSRSLSGDDSVQDLFVKANFTGLTSTTASLDILMICADAACSTANTDTDLRDYMNNTLGHNVTTDDATERSTAGFDAVVVSESVTSGDTAWLKDDSIGILTVEGTNNDEFDLGTSGDSTGAPDGDVEIQNGSHYITQDYNTNDVVTIASTTSNLGYMGGWSNDVQALAVYDSTPTQSWLLAVENGGTLTDLTTAAERRVFLGAQYFANLNSNGTDIFERSLNWVSYNTAGTQTGSINSDSINFNRRGPGGNLSISYFVLNSPIFYSQSSDY